VIGHQRLLAFAFAVQYSCTVPITNWAHEAPSHDGRARALIRSRGLKPHRLELRVESHGQVRTVFSQDYGEVHVGFCELHWTPDSRIVEMFVTNPVQDSDELFAYDIVGNQSVDRNWAAKDLRQSIAFKYSLDSSVDPLEWAHTTEAQDRFHGGRYKSWYN
jgi:hypothetical protein